MPHDHCSHDHTQDHETKKKHLILGMVANGLFTILELVVGLMTNSLVLLSDALHDFTDTIALFFSYVMHIQGNKSANHKKTFGYQRATILGAFINGTVLVILSLALLYKAVLRVMNPEPVTSSWLIIVAIFGLIANGFIIKKLGHHHHDLNIRAVWWHMMEDFLGWIAVLIGGIVMYFTKWYIIDPILSIIISLYVLYGGYRILNDTVNVLLEGAPKHIDTEKVKAFLCKQKLVENIHDLHIWSIGSEQIMLTCHVVCSLKTLKHATKLSQDLKKQLHEKFGIHHSTIEIESEDCGDDCGR